MEKLIRILALSSFILFLSVTIYSQKHIYRDIDDRIITKKEFKNIEAEVFREYLGGTIWNDILIETKLFKRRIHGFLPDSIITQLFEFADSCQYSQNKRTLIFNFYPGLDECNSTGSTSIKFYKSKNKQYQKLINKDGNIRQFYIYKTGVNLEPHQLFAKWWADPNGIIEEHFFKYEFPCGGHVIIDQNKFMVYYGESYPALIYENVIDFREIE